MENQLCQQAEKPDALGALKDLANIQGQNGNWNYDPYMFGLYNGLELAIATMENREPDYKDAPKIWLCDIPLGTLHGETESGA